MVNGGDDRSRTTLDGIEVYIWDDRLGFWFYSVQLPTEGYAKVTAKFT